MSDALLSRIIEELIEIKHCLKALTSKEEQISKGINRRKVDKLLDTLQASIYLGVTKGTLDTWRSSKKYKLPYVKVGRLVKYDQRDLDVFTKNRTKTQLHGK